MATRIITDSASDIVDFPNPNLTVLPMTVAFGSTVYHDGVDLTHERFYDLLVKEEASKPAVQVYAIGEDRWHQLDKWPQADGEAVVFFLTDKRDGKGYALSAQTAQTGGQISYRYDPQHPVLSVGGETLFNSGSRRGSQLQPEVGYRDDVISFVSEPLSEPLLMAGKVKVVLNVSSDCDDTAFSYKISEVFADGNTYNILKMRFNNIPKFFGIFIHISNFFFEFRITQIKINIIAHSHNPNSFKPTF